MDLAKVQVKPLAGERDWQVWKYRIKFILNCHTGALEVVEGSLSKPEVLAAEANEAAKRKYDKDLKDFQKGNTNAMVVLTNSMTEETLQKVMRFQTAREIWLELHKLYEASSENQLYNICLQFFQFKWNDSENIAAHLSKLKNLWNELNSGLQNKNEEKLPELLLNCKILDILPNEYMSFKSSWLLLGEDKRTADELTTQLCSYEREFRSNEKNSSAEHEALIVKEKRNKNNTFKKKTSTCNYCHQKGHWVKSCPNWIADGRPPKPNTDSRKSGPSRTANTLALTSICEEACATDTSSTSFWIDNGATRHVTNCPTYFVDFVKFNNPCGIKAAGNETLTALGKGTIKVRTTIDGKCQEVFLTDVWYVPKISRNLFSVLAAQDRNQNSKFESTPTECWLRVNNSVVLYGSRNLNGTLFKAAIEPLFPDKVIEIQMADADNNNSSLLQLYHSRWGHQDKRHIRNLVKKEFDINLKLDKDPCEPCIYGKAHRLKFGIKPKASKVGELISADVCGPFDESNRKYKYFVVFKDHFSKYRHVYFLKRKSDVTFCLKSFIAHAENLGHSVQEILSDNGGEFDNHEVQLILQKKGITQRLTAPYTPQQNGTSERENRTVVEMARTLKYSNPEIEFPPSLWAELINTAAYILNRTGVSSVPNTSPHELWFGKKPRIRHMRVIGSLCYTHIPSQNRRKMDRKAVKGFLIGYDGDERYRIWSREDRKLILSRDVIFQEWPGKCDDHTEIPLQDEVEEGSNQGKCEEQQIAIKKNPKDDQSQEGEESNAETDSEEEDFEPTFGRRLRNRSLLQKPRRFEDYIMEAESYINESENPATYEEAVNSRNSTNWKKAMDSEIKSLKENQTWELTELPVGARAIPCKWVYKLKTNPDGSINKYKARLVVKGFSQRQGIDYSETYSPVAKLGTIRAVLSIAAEERMHLTQFDVSTAFLYGELEEVIYMKQPQGFEDGTERVCRLNRSLYGLKQSPRCWNKCFGQFLTDLGFKVSEADPCLYIRERRGRKLLIALYVDDGLIAATDQQDSEMFIKELKAKFKISVGEVSCFLGLEIDCHSDNSITVSQKGYARKILKRFGFDECKPVTTPMLKDSGLQKLEDTKISDFPYRQAVGALMYLMVGTRPDLAYSVGFLSRSLEKPSAEDIVRVKRVFRYVAGTVEFGITYRTTDTKGVLQCYSDSDFGGCTKTGRSTSGYVMIYAGGAISWRSQRQAIVATSTTEAEVVAASEAAKEVIWLRRLFQDIVNLKEVPTLQVDNRAAVKLSHNPEYHRRTKHIEMKHFFVREKVLEGKLNVDQVSTERQVADILTKPLMKSRLLTLNNQMGLS